MKRKVIAADRRGEEEEDRNTTARSTASAVQQNARALCTSSEAAEILLRQLSKGSQGNMLAPYCKIQNMKSEVLQLLGYAVRGLVPEAKHMLLSKRGMRYKFDEGEAGQHTKMIQ